MTTPPTKEHLNWNKILRRIAIEFGPPAIIGVVWMCWDTAVGSPASEYFKQWSVSFFMASWVWAQLLRIVYQQNQIERLSALGVDLSSVKNTLAALRAAFDATVKGPPGIQPQAKQISDLIDTANNQIATANTTYEAARSYVLQAEPGRYRLTGGSE